MAPFLQAEADRSVIRRQYQDVLAEQMIMSEHKSWEAGKSVYSTDKYVPPVKPVLIGKKV